MTRMLRAIAIAALALTVLAANATADSAVSQSGTIGRYNVIDSAGQPGVMCGPTENETGIKFGIRGPRVFAVDRTDTVDEQTVGWQFLLRVRLDGKWRTVHRSTVTTSTANDEEAHTFDARGYQIDPAPTRRYRIRVRVIWYSGQFGIVSGKVTREVEFYRQAAGKSSFVRGPNGFCKLT